jgi:hypothetical protein
MDTPKLKDIKLKLWTLEQANNPNFCVAVMNDQLLWILALTGERDKMQKKLKKLRQVLERR